MKKKVIITLSLSWLLIVGYLTGIMGLKHQGVIKGLIGKSGYGLV